jgi:hypothetical protein
MVAECLDHGGTLEAFAGKLSAGIYVVGPLNEGVKCQSYLIEGHTEAGIV